MTEMAGTEDTGFTEPDTELPLGLPPKETPQMPLSAVLAAELLGERVAVKLDDHVIVVGVLLSFSDMGEVTVRTEDGDVHHCWPLLSVAPLDDGEQEAAP